MEACKTEDVQRDGHPPDVARTLGPFEGFTRECVGLVECTLIQREIAQVAEQIGDPGFVSSAAGMRQRFAVELVRTRVAPQVNLHDAEGAKGGDGSSDVTERAR